MSEINNWQRILLNDLPITFLLEVVFRTLVMFFVILITLRASGKRGIKQLSIFELVLIIGLGSAAGDPMFYEDVGILPAFTVFVIVILLYISVTRLADKFTWVEKALEGQPVYIINEGIIQVEAFNKSGLSQDELFAELRLLNVEHLGQVRTLLIETSGDFSVLFFADDDVVPGLPIFPDKLEKKLVIIPSTGDYACFKCGHVRYFESGALCVCPVCSRKEWVNTIDCKRIS